MTMTVGMVRARDVMNRDVVTVRDDMTVQELAVFLIDHEISGAPVQDANGRFVGVVSLTDIARVSSTQSSFARDESHPDFYVRGWEDRLEIAELAAFHLEEGGPEVASIMTPTVFCVDHDAPVSQIARTMLEAHIHRVLATDRGRIVGIVSSSDLLKLLV
jgi:CBS domain-containing protein